MIFFSNKVPTYWVVTKNANIAATLMDACTGMVCDSALSASHACIPPRLRDKPTTGEHAIEVHLVAGDVGGCTTRERSAPKGAKSAHATVKTNNINAMLVTTGHTMRDASESDGRTTPNTNAFDTCTFE